MPKRKTTPANRILVDRLKETDICCGRGKGAIRHPGNVKFQEFSFANLDRYIEVNTKQAKSQVVSCFVSELRRSGARFVRKGDDNRWYVIGVTEAHAKTGHVIRDCILHQSKRRGEKVQTNSSDSVVPSHYESSRGKQTVPSDTEVQTSTLDVASSKLFSSLDEELGNLSPDGLVSFLCDVSVDGISTSTDLGNLPPDELFPFLCDCCVDETNSAIDLSNDVGETC